MPEEYYDEDGFRLVFEPDTEQAEKQYYMTLFPNVNTIVDRKIHCTTCRTHIGTAPVSEAIIRMHPVLRVTHCRGCYAFYNSDVFHKGEDGSELYCRWCGQGGEVYCCSKCPYVFCKDCITTNLSKGCVQDIARNENWHCFACAPKIMWVLRAEHWALVNFIEKQKKNIRLQHSLLPSNISQLLRQDLTSCCFGKGINLKGNQPVGLNAAKTTRAVVEGEKQNNSVVANASSTKASNLKPMVCITPLPSSLLALSSTSGKSPTTPTSSLKPAEPKQQKNQKRKTSAVEEQNPATNPAAKKGRTGNNEGVVCTPDIMSMFTPIEDANPVTPVTKPPSIAPKTVGLMQNSQAPSTSTGGTVASGNAAPTVAARPRAILHKTMQRTLTVRMETAGGTPSPRIVPNRPVPDKSSQTLRMAVSGTPQSPNTPVYHIINGYRVDLHTAAQQTMYKLPNGKLIQVRKQPTDAAGCTTGTPVVLPAQPVDSVFGTPATNTQLVQHQLPNPKRQEPLAPNSAPRVVVIPDSQILQGKSLTSAQPQMLGTKFPQTVEAQKANTMFLAQQQILCLTQQQQLQKPQQLQHNQLLLQQKQTEQQQHSQQPQQMFPRHPVQQQSQFGVQQPRLAAQPQRPRQKRQTYGRRSQVQAQPNPPIPTPTSTPVQAAPTQRNSQQAPPQSNAESGQPQILEMLRGLVTGPHEDTPLGHGRKDFESKLLAVVDSCNHIIVKIQTLTNSNSFKNIRNLRDLKELFIHVSYLMTYGIGRFKILQERCEEDVKKMGFTKESDFVMMGAKICNRNPDENDNSDEDNDCEIIEQNPTVIEVDSDDDVEAREGRSLSCSTNVSSNAVETNNAAAASSVSTNKTLNSSASKVDNKHDETNVKDNTESNVSLAIGGDETTSEANSSTDQTNGQERAASQDTSSEFSVLEVIQGGTSMSVHVAEQETPIAGNGHNKENEQCDDYNTIFERDINPTDLVELIEMEESESVAEADSTIGMGLDDQLISDSAGHQKATTASDESAYPCSLLEPAGASNVCLAAEKDLVELIEISAKEVSELLNIDETNGHVPSNVPMELPSDMPETDVATQKEVTEQIEVSQSEDEKQNNPNVALSDACLEKVTTVSESAVQGAEENEAIPATEIVQKAILDGKEEKSNKTEIDKANPVGHGTVDNGEKDSVNARDNDSEPKSVKCTSTIEANQPLDKVVDSDAISKAQPFEKVFEEKGINEETHNVLDKNAIGEESTLQCSKSFDESLSVVEAEHSNDQVVQEFSDASVANPISVLSDKLEDATVDSRGSVDEISRNSDTEKSKDELIPESMEARKVSEIEVSNLVVESTNRCDETANTNDLANSPKEGEQMFIGAKDIFEGNELKPPNSSIGLGIILDDIASTSKGEVLGEAGSDDNDRLDPMDESEGNDLVDNNSINMSCNALDENETVKLAGNASAAEANDKVGVEAMEVSEENESKVKIADDTEIVKATETSCSEEASATGCLDPKDGFESNELKSNAPINDSVNDLHQTANINERNKSSEDSSDDKDCLEPMDVCEMNELEDSNLQKGESTKNVDLVAKDVVEEN